MATFDKVSRLVWSACKIGTPEPMVIANVLAKRDVFKLRSNLPYIGAVNSQVCQRCLMSGFLSNWRHIQNSKVTITPTTRPYARTKSEIANMMTVKMGNFCLVLAKTETICGTTYANKKITIANATTVTMAG